MGRVTFFHIDDMGYAGGTSNGHIGGMIYAGGTLMSLWEAGREGGNSYVRSGLLGTTAFGSRVVRAARREAVGMGFVEAICGWSMANWTMGAMNLEVALGHVRLVEDA